MKTPEEDVDEKSIVYIVDDDEGIRTSLSFLMSSVDQKYACFESAIDFLENFDPEQAGCLVLDIRMPVMSGVDLQHALNERNSLLPIIFITGHGDIPMAVEAIRQGAFDFICKPFSDQDLLDRINEAFESNSVSINRMSNVIKIKNKIATLSARELEVFEHVAKGRTNKSIGMELHISERTVEVHRAQVMSKLDVSTLPDLVRCKVISEQV